MTAETTTDTTTVDPVRARLPHEVVVRSPLRRALAAEWMKLASTRSLCWTLAVLTLVTPVMAVFVGLTGSLQPDDTVLGGSLTAAPMAQIIAGALGALVMTSEYTTRTARLTFAAVPRRGIVLSAKAILVAGLTFVAGTVSSGAAYLLGSATIDAGHATGELFPAVVGIGASFAAVAVLGLAVGSLLRHSAGAIAAIAAGAFVPTLIAPVFGGLQRWLAGASPTSALEKMTQTSDAAPDVVGSLGAWPSLALVAGYAAAALAAAVHRITRWDV